MSNILVTGGAGYIGSHACKILAEKGHTPITLDNLSRGHKESVQWGPLIKGSIHDYDLVTETLAKYQIQAVMHFAAYAYVGESMSNPTMYFDNNVKGSLLLLEAMKTANVQKIVFSSSCATYGQAQQPKISEDHPQKPINPYGLSKLMTENMLRKYAQAGDIQFCALRYFNAAGAALDGSIGECHDPEPHIIPNIISAALTKTPVSIFGNDYPTPDGTCVRDFIHVQDLAEAHALVLKRLLEDESLNNSFYNLGLSKGYSILELIRTIEKLNQEKVHFEFKDRRPGDPSQLIALAKKFENDFNWKPKNSDIQTIVQSAMNWKIKQES